MGLYSREKYSSMTFTHSSHWINKLITNFSIAMAVLYPNKLDGGTIGPQKRYGSIRPMGVEMSADTF